MDLEGYRRPSLARRDFHDATGAVIPYGHRWPFGEGPAVETYSVTAHPERFAPLLDVARALDAALPAANGAGGEGVLIEIRETDFPGVKVHVAGFDLPFPRCGCDACDEDVEELADDLENLIDAAVAGRISTRDGRFSYWGAWGSHGWNPPLVSRLTKVVMTRDSDQGFSRRIDTI